MNIDYLLKEKKIRFSQLNALDDQTFLTAAYAAILKRQPDPAGQDFYTQALRDGTMTRADVLGWLRFSPEGREHGVRISNAPLAFWRHGLMALPGSGAVRNYLLRCKALIGLPREVKELRAQVKNFGHVVERHLDPESHIALKDLSVEINALRQVVEREVGSTIPDHVYQILQDQFRGPARDMTDNLSMYLPLVRPCIGPDEYLLDIGCGRGEWLGLLADHQIPAQGMDCSPAMVEHCRRQGREVFLGDALDHLRGLPDNSLAALTAFQLMEHLSPSQLIRLWEEAKRVLRPGGMLLFETPNPENVQVATYSFFLDPTHKKPVPPPLATYTLHALGFSDIRVLRSKPVIPPVFSDPELNRFFSAAMDYAVVAYKDGVQPPSPSVAQNHLAGPPAFLGLKINGPFTGSYSLSLVNREIGLALDKTHPGRVGLCFENSPAWKPGEDPAYVRQHSDVERLYRQCQAITAPDVVMFNSYPPLVEKTPGALGLTNAYGWEESQFPPEFAQGFINNLSGMTLMSSYVRKTMQDNGVGLPMAVVGLGVDHLHRIEPEPVHHDLGQGFRFLHISSCFPRKGLDVLLRAYGQAFTYDDNVTLIVKTFPNPHNNAAAMISDFSASTGSPKVVLINEDLSPGQILELYRRSHCLVAPSRGEGFGLPMAEAMALELPVITTGYGGQTDFCTRETSWLIDYSFAPAQSHLSAHGSVWVEPDADHLASIMLRIFHADPDERRLKVLAAKALVDSEFTWAATAARLTAFITHLRRAPVNPSISLGWVSTWDCRCGIAEFSAYYLEHLDPDLNVTIIARAEENRADGWTSANAHEYIPDLVGEAGLTCVVINYHPAFFKPGIFRQTLQRLDALQVQVLVIFHATRNGEHILREMVPELSRVSRLLVHDIADMNCLKTIGLVDNVTLFPHGVNVGIEAHIPEGLIPDEFAKLRIIASSGFCMPHKGILELIEAFGLLAESNPEWGLLLANALYPREQDADYHEQCMDEICRLGLESRVHFITDFLPLEQSIAILRRAEFIVYPYRHSGESSSAGVRMGLAADRPVLCTDLPIFNDVRAVAHILPGFTPQEMAGEIQRLMLDTDLVRGVDKKRQDWIKSFSWSKVGQRMSGLLRSLSC